MDFTEAELEHAQHHRCKIGAADFRVGELRTAYKILLAIQPKAHAIRESSTATFALIGARPRDGFNRQALQAAARAVATDPRVARVNHVTNTGHRE